VNVFTKLDDYGWHYYYYKDIFKGSYGEYYLGGAGLEGYIKPGNGSGYGLYATHLGNGYSVGRDHQTGHGYIVVLDRDDGDGDSMPAKGYVYHE
jgi:hypothetical protein